MSVTVLSPKPMTPARRMAALEHPGRPIGMLGGTWNADQVTLKKCVILCGFCVHKFHPRRQGYEAWRDVTSFSRCDECRELRHGCKTFIHESTHDAVGNWATRPTHGRWVRAIADWIPSWWKR